MPEREKEIKEIIKTLENVWLKMPERRLGQLIDSCASYQKEDAFYIDDKKLMAELFTLRLELN